jgi:hypothetical protein
MAIDANGRFTPNATKGALELFSATDITRALHKLDCGFTRDQVALIASAYEQLFTPATVRRSESGLVRERLMKKVQDVFASTRQAQSAASACELLHSAVLQVRDDDWSGLHVRLAIALGMNPDASECAWAVVQLRREQGKKGEDAMFASEQFNDMWAKSDRTALDSAREFDGVLRDVARTCIAAAQKGALESFKATDEREHRAIRGSRQSHGAGKPVGRSRSVAMQQAR